MNTQLIIVHMRQWRTNEDDSRDDVGGLSIKNPRRNRGYRDRFMVSIGSDRVR